MKGEDKWIHIPIVWIEFQLFVYSRHCEEELQLRHEPASGQHRPELPDVSEDRERESRGAVREQGDRRGLLQQVGGAAERH